LRLGKGGIITSLTQSAYASVPVAIICHITANQVVTDLLATDLINAYEIAESDQQLTLYLNLKST